MRPEQHIDYVRMLLSRASHSEADRRRAGEALRQLSWDYPRQWQQLAGIGEKEGRRLMACARN